LDTLPKTLSVPPLFSDREAELLQGTQAGFYRQKMNDGLKWLHDYLHVSLFKLNPSVFTEEHFSLEKFRWAITTVVSRCFGSKKATLYPFLDQFNHRRMQGELTVRTLYDTKDNHLAYALKSFKKGEQVFISYDDEKGCQDLFNIFGFTDPDDKDDFLILPLVSKNGEPADHFVFRDMINPFFINVLRTLPSGHDNKEAALRDVITAAEKARAKLVEEGNKIPGSQDEDELLLAKPFEGTLTRNMVAALKYRVHIRTLLKEQDQELVAAMKDPDELLSAVDAAEDTNQEQKKTDEGQEDDPTHDEFAQKMIGGFNGQELPADAEFLRHLSDAKPALSSPPESRSKDALDNLFSRKDKHSLLRPKKK